MRSDCLTRGAIAVPDYPRFRVGDGLVFLAYPHSEAIAAYRDREFDVIEFLSLDTVSVMPRLAFVILTGILPPVVLRAFVVKCSRYAVPLLSYEDADAFVTAAEQHLAGLASTAMVESLRSRVQWRHDELQSQWNGAIIDSFVTAVAADSIRQRLNVAALLLSITQVMPEAAITAVMRMRDIYKASAFFNTDNACLDFMREVVVTHPWPVLAPSLPPSWTSPLRRNYEPPR